MAECKVKRDITVTLVLSEREAQALHAVLGEVQGGQRECHAVWRALDLGIVGVHPDIERLNGVITWIELVPF